jgi:L-iditol 2-dehydrogenase
MAIFMRKGVFIMKAAVFCGRGDIELREVPVRVPGPKELTVKVMACGVCGTDLHIFSGAEGAAQCTPPTILGHEFSGVVSAVGSAVTGFAPGDRVCVDPNDMCGACDFCRSGREHFCENMTGIGTTTDGGFAQFCTVAAKQAYHMGDELTFEQGAMTEPVSCCLHGMDLAGVKPGDTVMIIGGGTIGQIMLQLAKSSGAAVLIMSEPVAEKRELALRLGADIAVDPLGGGIPAALEAGGIKNIDVLIECVGSAQTMRDALSFAGRGASVMLFGLTDPACEIPLKPFELFKKELTVRASFINPYTFGRASELLRTGRVDITPLVTDRVPLERINEVFTDRSYRSRGKVIILPQGA